MLDFPVKYKIKIVNDKTGIIASNHKNKELLISKDIKLNITNDGKLCAMFPNFRQKSKSSKTSGTDCSVVISDPSCFNHCVQKDGAYQLSGSKVTFNGSNNDNTLILNGVDNSEINMGKGNDTILYREKKVYDNKINLGDGDNYFLTTGKTEVDRALINNNISSGDGKDYVYLRNSIGNKIDTGAGKDLVEIDGAPQTEFMNSFEKNSINTGKGDDQINISGNFERFSNNEFYLGKGSDNFNAEINKNADANITTEFEHAQNSPKFIQSVSNNRIYGTDGDKGFFEKNSFEATSFSANQLCSNTSPNSYIEGFDNIKTKPIPQPTQNFSQEDQTVKSSTKKKLTREDYTRKYNAYSLGAMMFNDPKMQESAFKVLDDYVNSMAND